MGRDSVQMGVHMKKLSVNSVRLFNRSICKHPFLAGLLCFLLFLYKTFPFLLSLLVTASPVLVCTAVLLATLLSFGQPNIPDLEKEEEVVTHELASLKANAIQDATVVERDVSFATERFVGLGEEVEPEVGKIKNVLDSSSVDNVLLVDDKSQEDQYEKQGVDEDHKERSLNLETEGMASDAEETEHLYSLIGQGRDEDLDGEEVENQYTLIGQGRDEDHHGEETKNQYTSIGQGRDEDHDGEETENQYTSIGQERDENLEVETDKILGELGSSHTRLPIDSEEEEEDDDQSSDYKSDDAESSSPDASLTDITPLLDELHPLLDEEAPHPVHMSHDDDSESESADDSEDKEEEDGDGDDEEEEDGDGDGDEEEPSPGEKGDESTSPITWTEDDQKNVMDLGTSEIERNQRLESLIARRKARKAMSMMKHKDLIDFDSDLLFKVQHITTTRRNPFDGPDDSYADLGLPPIPGSAPSIMLPSRNPFDIPYDSSEEKPDLKGDSFEEEFTGFHQKDSTIFRRHESFSWGPSTLGGQRKEKREINWRPFFVAESLASEGTSSPSLHRQLSEISSVPDTGSVVSAVDQDELKLNDLSQETELMPHIDHASDHDDQESQSSDDADSVHIEEIVLRDINHDEVEIATRDLQTHPTAEAGDAATPMELGVGENNLKPEEESKEATAQFTDKESETGIEKRAMDIHSNEVICAASLLTHEVDANVSRSKEVVEVSDHDGEKDSDNPNELDQLASSNVDAEVHVVVNQNVDENNSENITLTTEEEHITSIAGEHGSASSEVETAEEPALDEAETHHLVLDERKIEDEFHLPNLDAEVDEDVHEQFDSVAVDQVLMVHPSSLDRMLDKEEAPEFEQKEVHSSSYDANVSADLHPGLNVKVVSQRSYEDHAPSDKSMVEPSLDDHYELQEQSFVQTEIMDAEEGVTDNVTVPPSLDSTLNSSKTSEYESSISGEVLKNDDEDQVQASGLDNSSSVPCEILIPEANIKNEEDDVKEIGEGLLSELDRVGDFCIEEVDESIHNEMIQEETTEFEPLVAEANLELPAFEARSVEDIEMAFKKLHEGVDIEEVILPSSFKEEIDMENSEEPISNYAVINARSVDDIDGVLKEISDSNLGKSPEPLDSKDGLTEDQVSSTEEIDSDRVESTVEEAYDYSNLQVIDARSLEDIHVALNEVSAEPLESKDGLAEVEADRVSSTKDLNSVSVQTVVEETSMVALDKPVDGLDEATDSSNLQVLDARSADDIDVPLKEVSDTNMGKSPEPLESKDGSAGEVEVDKVSSTEDLDLTRV